MFLVEISGEKIVNREILFSFLVKFNSLGKKWNKNGIEVDGIEYIY